MQNNNSYDEGLAIIKKYDSEPKVNVSENTTVVIVKDYLSTFAEEDNDKLQELGWDWEDREVWSFSK